MCPHNGLLHFPPHLLADVHQHQRMHRLCLLFIFQLQNVKLNMLVTFSVIYIKKNIKGFLIIRVDAKKRNIVWIFFFFFPPEIIITDLYSELNQARLIAQPDYG